MKLIKRKNIILNINLRTKLIDKLFKTILNDNFIDYSELILFKISDIQLDLITNDINFKYNKIFFIDEYSKYKHYNKIYNKIKNIDNIKVILEYI